MKQGKDYFRPDLPENTINILWEKEINGFRSFLEIQEYAPATVERYLQDLMVLKKYLKESSLISKYILIEFKEWLWEKYSLDTCNARLAGVNRFLDYLGAAGLKLKLFKGQHRMMRSAGKNMSIEDYRSLVAAAKARRKMRLVLGMETIVCTGVRISELKYFTVENVRKGQITIRNKGKIRVIPVPKHLKQSLLLYAARKKIGSGSIFVTSGGKPVDRSNFWREMQQLRQEAHIRKEKIFPHNLRHLFAHLYYQMTKDIAGLSDILGHSNVNVTRIYTMKTREMQQDMLEKVRYVLDTY